MWTCSTYSVQSPTSLTRYCYRLWHTHHHEIAAFALCQQWFGLVCHQSTNVHPHFPNGFSSQVPGPSWAVWWRKDTSKWSAVSFSCQDMSCKPRTLRSWACGLWPHWAKTWANVASLADRLFIWHQTSSDLFMPTFPSDVFHASTCSRPPSIWVSPATSPHLVRRWCQSQYAGCRVGSWKWLSLWKLPVASMGFEGFSMLQVAGHCETQSVKKTKVSVSVTFAWTEDWN